MAGTETNNTAADDVKRGIGDQVVDWTCVSYVDGEKGRLSYRGIDIAELAAHSNFEECAYLLLTGVLPTQERLQAFNWKLRQIAMPPDRILRIIKELPVSADPLLALQVALSALGCLDPGDRLSPQESKFENALRIIAQTPVIIAASFRHSKGLPMIAPLARLNQAENFLYMLTGEIPSKARSFFLESALVTQMDHGFNPSTFTARAVASTLSSTYAATSAAVGALSGRLHGGASVSAREMVKSLSRSNDVEKEVRKIVREGGRIMGMGHRRYRTKDPRASILEDLVRQMTKQESIKKDFEFMKKIEKIAMQELREVGKPLYVNVDFWSGTLYSHLGLESSLYPAIFASSRIVGWCAHIIELSLDNKLYRPLAEYRGARQVPYTPISERRAMKEDRR